MSKVIVIGAGAAGMMAACMAAQNGNQVLLLEKNEKLGKKIYITGKGRCNLTNASDLEQLFSSIVTNEKFLYSALYGFDNQTCMEFFEQNGLKIKVERGNRVFPVSDHASDVIKAMENAMKQAGVKIKLFTQVKKLKVEEEHVSGVVDTKGNFYEADAVVVATGGCSYPTTGSTGDGYRFAEDCGHKIVEPVPALVPLQIQESFCKELQGLSLKNVSVQIKDDRRCYYEDFGEMLFTHFGVSGPLILSASSYISKILEKKQLTLLLDLKPNLSRETLDKRLLREFEQNQNKQFKNAVSSLFPSKMIPVMIALSGIDPDKKVHEITREERTGFVALIKEVRMTITGTNDFKEAIITQGGVSVKDVNPSTMESKKITRLYFAGEVLDIDALTGGYNLQLAWSTGHLAGESIEA